jgi:hypothetical protein
MEILLKVSFYWKKLHQKMKEILKSKFPLINELLQSNNLVELAD